MKTREPVSTSPEIPVGTLYLDGLEIPILDISFESDGEKYIVRIRRKGIPTSPEPSPGAAGLTDEAPMPEDDEKWRVMRYRILEAFPAAWARRLEARAGMLAVTYSVPEGGRG